MAAVSEETRARKRQADREAYQWYKSHGICPKCKREWSRPGRVFCEACAKVKQKSTQKYCTAASCKARRERLKAQGLCVNCTRQAVPGRVLCAECARKNSEAQQVRKMRRRLAREAEKELSDAKLSMV